MNKVIVTGSDGRFGKILKKMEHGAIVMAEQDTFQFNDVQQLLQLGFIDASDAYHASNNTNQKPCP